MPPLGSVVRLVVVLFGFLQLIVGLGLVVSDDGSGMALMAVGAFFVVVPLIERGRYRSEATERTATVTGPGGGETSDEALEPRFRPTTEVFVDPTTGHRMRVLVDSRTGERRYVAEG
jgi:hypothetical protein